jgi:hypothetical protein
MPIVFHFRPEVNLVICVHKGNRPDDEFLSASKSLYENDLFNLSMNRLVDMRQAKNFESRSSTVLQQLSEFVKMQFTETNAHPKIAIIAPEDISFGLSRMYETYTDSVPWDLVVFRSVDTALAWLGLPEDFMDNFDNETP